jgi:hypothetical protein
MSDVFKWLMSVGVTPFAILGWLCLGVLAWSNMRWRVKNLEDGQSRLSEEHKNLEKIIDKQVDLTRDVELNNRELKVICAVTERRLTLVEDRNR